MSSFKFCYLEACDNLNVTPQEKILLNIEQALNLSCLNLSTVEITDDICKVIGFALCKDVFLTELDLSNCILSDSGVSNILLGLEKNNHLRTLNLKGNNIRGIGTEAIGKFLRHNNYLENLYLEWNNTGIFPEKFLHICEGLSINNTLKSLDLKNNQLNHLCAQSISDVLYRNSTLQKLDLRWNAIGLIGGRALLKALSNNKSVLKLDISGNDVPVEIQKSIELITSVSTEKYLMNNESIEKTKAFASKLQEIEMERSQQVKSMMEQLERRDKDFFIHQSLHTSKLGELQEILCEKNETIEILTKNLKEMQRSLNLVVDEKNNLALTLNKIEYRLKESKKEYLLLYDMKRKENEDVKDKLLEEIGTLKEENLLMKQRIQDYKALQTNLEIQIEKLKISLTKAENAAKLEEESFHEQITLLNEKHQETLRENVQNKKNEINRLKEEFSVIEKKLTNTITLLENKNTDLEKLINENEDRILESKTHTEQMVENLKKEKIEDEEKLRKQMEERIEILESSNKKQDELLKEQVQIMYEIKTKCRENDLLLAESTHHSQCLEKSLQEKDAEIEVAISKVKLEVKEQLEELIKVKNLFQNSNAENTNLKQKLEEIEIQHREEINKKDETMRILKSEISKLKTKVKEILENENQRIKDLQTVLVSCMNSSKLETDAESEYHEQELNIDIE